MECSAAFGQSLARFSKCHLLHQRRVSYAPFSVESLMSSHAVSRLRSERLARSLKPFVSRGSRSSAAPRVVIPSCLAFGGRAGRRGTGGRVPVDVRRGSAEAE